jgi:hypothetical protein
MDQVRDDIKAISEPIRASGEPVIVERAEEAVVALVSLEDLDVPERGRHNEGPGRFSRSAAGAARSVGDADVIEDEVVR